jgi:hypothetical protein
MDKLLRTNEIKLSLGELSELFGVDADTVKSKLSDLPTITGPYKSTLYPLKEAIGSFFFAGDETLQELKLARERAETRLAVVRANKIDMENKKRSGELIEMKVAEQEYGDLIAQFRSKMLVIPNRAALRLAAIRTPGEVEEYLTELIYEALSALSQSASVEANQ